MTCITIIGRGFESSRLMGGVWFIKKGTVLFVATFNTKILIDLFTQFNLSFMFDQNTFLFRGIKPRVTLMKIYLTWLLRYLVNKTSLDIISNEAFDSAASQSWPTARPPSSSSSGQSSKAPTILIYICRVVIISNLVVSTTLES